MKKKSYIRKKSKRHRKSFGNKKSFSKYRMTPADPEPGEITESTINLPSNDERTNNCCKNPYESIPWNMGHKAKPRKLKKPTPIRRISTFRSSNRRIIKLSVPDRRCVK